MAKKQNITEDKMLTENEVYDVIKMASRIYTNPSFYDPSLLNNNLSALVNDPSVPKSQDVQRNLANYTNKGSSEMLQSYNDFMEVYDVFIQKIVDYLTGLLSFDVYWAIRNSMSPSDYKSKEYINDTKRRDKFLDNFNYKEEFSKVLKNVIKRGVYFVWLRGTKEAMSNSPISVTGADLHYALQPLPQKYCKISELYNGGMLFDIDMSYFNQAGTDINGYAPIFKEYLNRVYDNVPDNYIPTAPLNKRKGASTTWAQTSPVDGAWCFKWDTSNLAIVPYLSNMIMNCLDNNTITKLQMDKDIMGASALIIGDMPLNNKQKGATTSNAFAIKPETSMTFMELVKKGLKRNINAVMMPTENSKLYQYQDYNENMADLNNKALAGKGVSASGLIYSTDKSSQAEIEAQILNDYTLVSKLYNQFETFLNFYVNRKTSKYKWNFHFTGSNQTFIQKAHKDSIMALINVGVTPSASVLSTVVGIPPHDFERILKEARYGGMDDMLMQLNSIHTSNNKESGAPTKDSSDLSDGGSIARDY